MTGVLFLGEVALIETIEAGAVAGFVFCHFVDSVVDGIIAKLLGAGGDGEFAVACAGFGLEPFLEIGLGIPYYFAEEFCEFGGVISLFESVSLECFGDFRIAFALGLAAHG